jgi:hypothetical protein
MDKMSELNKDGPAWLERPIQDQRPATKYIAAFKYNKRKAFFQTKSVSI